MDLGTTSVSLLDAFSNQAKQWETDHHKARQCRTWEDPSQKGQTACTGLHDQTASLARLCCWKLGVFCPYLLPATSACGAHFMFQRNAKFHPGSSPGTPQAPAQQQPLPSGSWPSPVQRCRNAGSHSSAFPHARKKQQPINSSQHFHLLRDLVALRIPPHGHL